MPAPGAGLPENQLNSPVMSESEVRHGSAAAADPLAVPCGGGRFTTYLAVVFVAGLGALTLLASGASEPFVLTLMAFLATFGVFFLFGLAAGHVRITERAAEADLAKAIVEAGDDGVFVSGRDGRGLYANRAFIALLGRSEAGEGHSLETAFSGEPRATEALFRLARAADRGESREEEFCVQAPAAGPHQPRWYRLRIRQLHRGGHYGRRNPLTLWRLADVSDQRRREAETRRVAEALLAHYEAIPLGLFVAQEDGRIEHLNATLGKWLGLCPETLAGGLKLTDVLPGDGATLVLSLARQAAAAPQRIDLDLVRGDGRSWPVSLMLAARRSGDGAGGFSGALLERGTEDESKGSGGTAEVRFARFFQSAPFGIATVGADGRIVSANAAFTRLLLDDNKGDQADLAIDRLAHGAEPDTRAIIEATLSQALTGKANIPPFEITVGTAREFTRRVFLSPLAQASAAREAAILYVIDATEQKALEIKFAQSQKMEAVGKLAGGIAHDFNNVLTAIIGFSDLLLQTHRPGDPAYKNIINIKSSANRAADLVSQLLAFSRRQTLQPEVLRLGDVLTDLSVLLNRLLGEKIDLKISSGRDLWYVKADPTQLGQVVINLAVNARDAMPDGGRLTIRSRNISERESQRLEAHGLAIAEYVLIEVEDTGHGMSAEVQGKVFEPFFTTKGIGKGTGLGLSTVYGIVKQTGGYIFVESALSRGTTFRVYLPRHHVESEEEVVATKLPKKERQADLTGTGRVLLVEDEDAVRSFAVEALKRQGYEVIQASSGAEALEVMDASLSKVDIVVSDVIMPELDGPSMFKELRKSDPDLKIIFMSGYPDDAFKNNLDPDTKFAFLQKPFSLAQLAAKVKEELGR
jgi:two-component system cell cycle sensor histidine kinase/response regulator CckA